MHTVSDIDTVIKFKPAHAHDVVLQTLTHTGILDKESTFDMTDPARLTDTRQFQQFNTKQLLRRVGSYLHPPAEDDVVH